MAPHKDRGGQTQGRESEVDKIQVEGEKARSCRHGIAAQGTQQWARAMFVCKVARCKMRHM